MDLKIFRVSGERPEEKIIFYKFKCQKEPNRIMVVVVLLTTGSRAVYVNTHNHSLPYS